jgi:ArsR family transcriptional regulator
MDKKKVTRIVQEKYGSIARNRDSDCCSESNCCGSLLTNEDIAKSIGYSEGELNMVPEANLGLGCGNPLVFAKINEGDVVLDLGSGAGFDSFLAAKKVGRSGRVIGIDITVEMISKAKENAEKYNYNNIEFKLADIEQIPLADCSVDKVISNCVINLVPDKKKVFKEAYRVLKKHGKAYISDIVLLEELTIEQRNDPELIAGCVGGAILRDDYLEIIKSVGFEVKAISEDREISERQYNGLKLESLKIEATKI